MQAYLNARASDCVPRSFGEIFMSVHVDPEAGKIVQTGELRKTQTVVYFSRFPNCSVKTN